MGYTKILVAIDGSPLTEVVFEKALEIAKYSGASVMLFRCLPFEHPEMSYSDLYGQNLVNFSQMMQEHLEQETEKTRQWMQGYCDRANQVGLSAEWDWKLGEAGQWICKLAQTWEADLIVVGRRGRQGIAEMLMGSVSNYVLHRAPCSVLVVQGIALPETA